MILVFRKFPESLTSCCFFPHSSQVMVYNYPVIIIMRALLLRHSYVGHCALSKAAVLNLSVTRCHFLQAKNMICYTESDVLM